MTIFNSAANISGSSSDFIFLQDKVTYITNGSFSLPLNSNSSTNFTYSVPSEYSNVLMYSQFSGRSFTGSYASMSIELDDVNVLHPYFIGTDSSNYISQSQALEMSPYYVGGLAYSDGSITLCFHFTSSFHMTYHTTASHSTRTYFKYIVYGIN